ncbi:MAG: AAA family ATPase [Anaerolineales bacterium]|nr:AAA family ATPase [Anaerolineales bacterium]
MKSSTRVQSPVTFSPAVLTKDVLANYWLRQVTLRMRREISWIWYERGVLPEAQHAGLPPFIDALQSALDMSRFWEEKSRFFQSDPTARYLSELLDRPPPSIGGRPAVGSFSWITDELGLDDLACFMLALGLAAAFDSAVGHVIAACLNDPTKTSPNLALAQKLWDEPDHVLRVVNPTHSLFRYGLLQFRGPSPEVGTEIDWEATFGVAAPVANQVLFPNTRMPEGLATLTSGTDVSTALGETARLVAARLKSSPALTMRVVPVRGPKGSAHAEVVSGIAQTTGRQVVRYVADPSLLEDARYRNALAALCWLKGTDLFLGEDLISTRTGTEKSHSSAQILPSLSIPITLFLGIAERSQMPKLPERYLLPIVDVPAFPYAERVTYWKAGLGKKARRLDDAIAEIARRFRYGKETIDSICEGLKALPGSLTAEDLAAAARAEVEIDVGELAQKVTPRFQEEKLILPHKQELQFKEVIRAMHSLTEVHYGWGTAKAWNEGGIAVLFAGPPGTGKTMAAEILAIELELPMYRIDLSQVVNKYIGETEKNLKRLFDAADISDLILFFDEADSLFGQRTEVRDAHDRYANLEISYLLERMERFKGLAILATNRKKDLDEAFLRRLRYIIDFPLPDADQRKKIWLQVTPKTVDATQVDYDFLARQFRLAGGHIRSIVFNACLQSANGDNGRSKFKGRLTMKEIIVAVKREYDKLKRPVSLEHFGPYAEIVEAVEHAQAG